MKQSQSNPKKPGITILENKKRKTGIGLEECNETNTELDIGSEENTMCLDHDTQDNSNLGSIAYQKTCKR